MTQQQPKILVADPEQSNLTFYRERLSELGLSCITTSQSANVVQLIKDKSPNFLLIDSSLQDPDGYQLLNHLLSDDSNVRLPILFTVGNLSEKKMSLHQELMQFVDVLPKPINHHRFAQLITDYKKQFLLRTVIESLANKDEPELVDAVEEGILGIDSDGQIIYANYAAERLLKQRFRDLEGCYLESLFEDACKRTVSQWMQHPIYKVTLSDQILQVENATLWRADGEAIQAKFVAAPFHSDTGISLLFAFRQLKGTRESKDKIARLAQLDHLTGLPTRLAFQEHLERNILKAGLTGHYCALLFVDLDHFRYINESLGHDRGDALIKQVAERVEQLIRRDDLVGRMEGDEFVVLLSHIDAPENAGIVAKKIVDQIREPFLLDGHEVFTGCSIGVSVFPSCGDNATALMKNAQTALARAKQVGRNNYQYFTVEMNKFRSQEVSFVFELRQAVENKQWRIQYMPVIDASSGNVVACDVKLSWVHPLRGELSLDQFLSVAEESGLAPEIFIWLWQQALQRFEKLEDEAKSVARLILPVSSSTILREGGIDWVNNVIEEAGLSPDQVYLELPEGQLNNRDGQISQALNELCRSGFHLILDSFGTGFAPLTLLKEVPYSLVKLSENFVNVCEVSKTDQAIIKGVVHLVHQLGIQVMATSIDSDKQLAFLSLSGCDWLSGDTIMKELQQTPQKLDAMGMFVFPG